MPSLTSSFDELIRRVPSGRGLSPTGSEPLYYLIFSPKQILEVKRIMPAWVAKFRIDGWEVSQLSMAQEISDILHSSPLMQIWLEADKKLPLQWERTNQALADAITDGALIKRLESKLDQVNGSKNGILLVTDLEALHPYTRIGTIESQLIGKFRSPTVFFYPGERTGKTRLKFLGFYPEDGNYRSVHIGG